MHGLLMVFTQKGHVTGVSPGKAFPSQSHRWEAAVAVLAWPRKKEQWVSHTVLDPSELKISGTQVFI